MTAFVVGYISPNISPKKNKEESSLQFVSLERTRLKLEKAGDRIRELEENLHGKQLVLNELAAENALLKNRENVAQEASQHGNSTQGEGEAPRQRPDEDDAYEYKLDDYDEVLKAKDGVIEQLTVALQASNQEKEQAQKDSMAQASQLADEIHRLQQQLKQSSELLDHQLGIPAQALLEAKNEILALQTSLDVKETEVESMTEAIRQRDTALTQLAEKYQNVSQQLSAMTEQSSVLQTMSQEKEHWHVSQQQWTAAEHHLKEENAKYMAEIQALRNSLQQKDSSISDLNASMSTLSSEKGSRISELERSIHSYEREIVTLKDQIFVRENELLQEVTSLKDTISTKDSTIYDFERQLAELTRLCSEKDGNVSHLQSELHVREEEILSLKDNLSSNKKEIDDLLSQNSHLQKANQSLSGEIKQLRDVLGDKESSLESVLKQSEDNLKEKNARVVELEKSCCEYREEINQHMDDLSLKSREINELSLKCEHILEESAKHSEENKTLKATLSQKDSEMELLERHLQDNTQDRDQRLANLNTEIWESSQEIGRLREKSLSCEREIEHLSHVKEEISSEKSRCIEEISVLKGTVSEAESRYENLKRQFDESRTDYESRISSLTSDLVSLQQTVSNLQDSKTCDEQSLEQMNERLSEHKSEASNLRGALSQREEMVRSLESELSEKSNTISDLEGCLSRKSDEVSQLQQVISDREGTLQSLESEMNKKDNVICDLEGGLSKRSDDVSQLQGVISDREATLQSLESELNKKKGVISDLEDSISKKCDELSRIQEFLSNKEADVQSLESEMNLKNRLISDLEGSISEKSAELCKLQEILSSQEQTVQSHESEMNKKNNVISDLEGSLSRRSDEVSQLQVILSSKESGVSEITALLSQRETDVRDLENRLREKDVEIDTLSKNISDKDAKLHDTETELRNKDSELQDVVNKLSAKDSEFCDLRNQLQDNVHQLEKLSAEREQQENTIKALSATVAEKDGIFEKEVKENEKKFAELQVHVAERNAACRSLKDELHYKEIALSDLTQSLELKQKSLLDLQTCLDEATVKLNQQANADNEKVLRLEKVLEEKDTILTDLRFKLSDLSGQNADLENENKSLKDKVNSMLQVEGQLVQVQKEFEDLSEKLSSRNAAYDELNNTVETLNVQISNLETEKASIICEKGKIEQSLEESKEELQRCSERLQAEKDELQNVLSLSRSDYERIAESMTVVQREKQELEDRVEKLQFDKLEITQTMEILSAEKEDLMSKQEEMNSQLSDQSTASDTLAFEKDELIVRLESLESENLQMSDKKSDVEKELGARESAIAALREQVSSLQAQIKETSDHHAALQKSYDEKCEELGTIHSTLYEKTEALNELEAAMDAKLAASVQEAVEKATQNYVSRIEELTSEMKDLKNRENDATSAQESLEQKVARLSDSWTVVQGVEGKHQAIDKVMQVSGTSVGSSAESASSMEYGSDERKVLSPVMRGGALQTSTSSSSSAQESRMHELESEVSRLQEILHDRERTVLDSTKGATQNMRKKNEQIKTLTEKSEKQTAQIKTMKEKGTALKNDYETLKTKYAALQSQLKTRGAKVTIPQKLEASIKEKVVEINRLKEEMELRDAQIITLREELNKQPTEVRSPSSSSSDAMSPSKAGSSSNGDLSSEIQRVREENTVLVEKLQLISDEHSSAFRSVKSQKDKLSEQLSEERLSFEKEKASFEEEKRRWEQNIRSLSGRHQELYQQTATSNLDILTQLERLKAENSQFKGQVDELSTKLAIQVSRDDEASGLKQELTSLTRNHELLKMELQTARAALYELESRSPDVLVYRRKLDDLHATLQVTWIENEELKAQVMQLKYQLGLDAEDESTEASTGASGQDGQSNVQRQIQKLKLEHATQTEKLTNELDTVKAKAKEIEIEKDSLHTKYQQEMRVKEKEHLNVLNELTRQLEHTRSVLDSLRSEYRHSQQEVQKLEDEKEAMQKSYGQAVEAMRRDHQETLHRVRSQADKQNAKSMMAPLKENASADAMQVRARLNLLMDEKIKLSKERDQLISERQDLIIERELMLAEKMQLVSEKDKLATENACLKAKSGIAARDDEVYSNELERNMYAMKQRHEEELQALRDNLNDGHRAEVLLLKKTIVTVVHEEIRRQVEISTQIIHQVLGRSSHPDVTRAHQVLQAQLIDQMDNMKTHLTEHGVLSLKSEDTTSDMQRMVRYLQQQNQTLLELAEAKETLLERSDAHTPLSFAELSDQDSLDIMQRSLEHDGFAEPGDSTSMHDSLEDYSEADFRAQIDVLQRENTDLRRRIEGDCQNLNVVHSLKKEIVGIQAKYLSVMHKSAIHHMRDIDSASQEDESESQVTPPQRCAIEPGVDWKKKYDDLNKETELLRGRIDALTLSHQLSARSPSVENLKARYEAIMEENEILRAKLGSYGLPTEGTPEEDSFDLQTKVEAVMKENENLRTKLDNYSMSSSSSQQRDEDWKSKFDSVLKDLDSIKCIPASEVGKTEGDVKQGLYELQGFYDSVVKEKEVLQVKLESVQDNAEKDFADLQTRHKQLFQKHQEVREKWKRTIEKSRKERSKLKARFVAALKEINILKQRNDKLIAATAKEESSLDDVTDVSKSVYDEQGQVIDSLRSRLSVLQSDNNAMKAEIGNLKSQSIGGLRRKLREAPQSADDTSEAVYESLQDKYTTACKEIEYLRSQLDEIHGKMLDDLNSDVKGEQTDSKPLHSQLAYLKAAGVGDNSISESVDFLSTDPNDSDSDTSGDSLDLEMETDYEVLVQEYERLRSQGPAEIQLEYEAVLRRLNLQDVFSSPKRRALNVTESKECKSDPMSSEAQITKGSSSSIVSQRSRQQQPEGVLPGDIMPDQAIDKQSHRLETLKAQYEEEVEQLRMELQQAKKGGDQHSAADHSQTSPKMDNSHDSSQGSQHNHDMTNNHVDAKETMNQAVNVEEMKQKHQNELSVALESQKKRLDERHKVQTEELRKQLKDEYALQLEAEKGLLEISHKSKMDELRSKQKTELEEALEKKEFELQEAHQEELKSMEAEWMRSDGQWLSKIEELNSQHKQELQDKGKNGPGEEYVKELRAQIEQEILSELKEKHSKEMAELQEASERKLAEHTQQLQTLEEELSKAKSDLAEHSQEHLQGHSLQHAGAMESLSLGSNLEITENKELQQHYEDLLAKHKEEIEGLKRQLQSLESSEQVTTGEKSHVDSDTSETLTEIQTEHAKEIAQLKQFYEKQLVSKVNDFQNEVARLQSRYEQEIDSARSKASEDLGNTKGVKGFEYEETDSEAASRSAKGSVAEAVLISFDDDHGKQQTISKGNAFSGLLAAADEFEDVFDESFVSEHSSKKDLKDELKIPIGDRTIDSSQGGFEYIMSEDSESEEEIEVPVQVTDEDKNRVDSPFPGADEDEAEEVETEESVSTARDDLDDQLDLLMNASFQSGGNSLPLVSPDQPFAKSNSLQPGDNQSSQLLQPNVGPTVTVSDADDDFDSQHNSGAIDVEVLQSQIDKLTKSLEDSVKHHEEEFKQLQHRQEEELANLQKRLDESYTDEMEKMKKQHELEIQELQGSSKTDEEKGMLLSANDDNEIVKLKEKINQYEAEIEKLKKVHEYEITALRDQMESQSDEIESLEQQHKRDAKELSIKAFSGDHDIEAKLHEATEERDMLKIELEDVREKYESMKDAHEETISSVLAKHESRTEEIKALMETDFRELNERNLEELRKELEDMHEMTVSELQQQHEQALEELRQQQEEELKEREQSWKEEQAEEIGHIRHDLMQKYSMEETDHWTKEIYSLKSELDVKNEELHKVRSDLLNTQNQMIKKEQELNEKHKMETENLIEELGRRQENAVSEAKENATKEVTPRIAQLEKLLDEHEQQIDDLEESNEQLLREKEDHKREMEEKIEEVRDASDDLLQRRIEEELFRQQQELEAGHLQQIDLLKEEYDDLLVSKQRQLEALHFSKEQESDRLQQRIEQELERQQQELEIAHSTEIDALQDKYEGVLKEKMMEIEKLYAVLNDTQNYSEREIQDEISNKMQEMQTKHNFEMEELKREYEALVKSKENQIQEKVLNDLNRQKSEEYLQDEQKAVIDDELVNMKLHMHAQKISSEAILSVLEREVAEKSREVEANSEEYKKRLDEMKETLQREFDELKGQLEERHAAAMEAAETEHEEEAAKMREKQILEMAEAKQQWAAANGHREGNRDGTAESPDSTMDIPDSVDSVRSAKDAHGHNDSKSHKDGRNGAPQSGDYSEMLEQLQKERDALERQKDNLKKQLDQEKSSHEQARAMMEKYHDELEELKRQHEEQIDDLRVSIQEELLVEHKRKLEAMTEDLQNAHTEEMKNLKAELADQYQAQIDDLESSLNEAKNEAEKVRKEMEDKHEKEIEELRRQMQEAAENESAESVQKLKEQHTEQLSAAALDTDVAKSELEEAHASELQQYRDKLEVLQREHQQEKESYVKKIADLQEQLRASSGDQDMVEELQQQKEKLKETLSQRTEEVENLNDQLESTKEKVVQLEKQLDDMEKKSNDLKEQTSSEQRKSEGDSDMLEVAQQELSKANSEREYLKLINERLRNVLSETVMTTMSTEERINRQLANLVAEGRKSPGSRSRPGHGGGDSGGETGNTDEEPTQDGSTLSMFSDEGLDLSQRISESLFVGPDIDSDNDFVYDATNRLQAGVEHILDMITTATRQLHEAQATQRNLVETVNDRNQEIVDLQNKLEDQENKFKHETETREFLAVELNKAEGLLEGYVSEKKQLEETLKTMEEEKEALVTHLEMARAHLTDFQDSEADLTAREDHIQRQTLALEQSIGQEEQDLILSPSGTPRQRSSYTGLLQENAKLSSEKRDLEKQFQHESQVFQNRISEMEMNGHDIQAQYEQQLQEKKIEIEDLQRQIQNLDKKLKSNQQFIEEQSAEREQEREESQTEIRKLQNIVKEKEKHQTSENRLQRELSADLSVELDQLKELYEFSKVRALTTERKVQDLEDHLKERVDAHSELRLKYEQLERDIQGLQVVLRERESLIKQLEEELDAKHQAEHDISEKLKRLEKELARQQEANIELTAELRDNINADELQQAVKDLEAQLEHARTSERLSQERCHQLEQELKNLKTLEEELKADKEVLQKQVFDQLNHISTLKLQVEDMKLTYDQVESKTVKELRSLLAQEREAMETKDKEMSDLSSQLEQFRDHVVEKNDEIQQMAAQLKVTDTEHEHRLVDLQETCARLSEANAQLKKQIEDLKSQPDSSPISQFAQNLIDSKNEEIDELNRHVIQLKEELDHVKTTEYTAALDVLKQEIIDKNAVIETKTVEVKELKEQLDINLTTHEEVVKLQEEINEKENVVVNLEGQVTTLHEEIDQLNNCQNKLQDDFDEVQKMLDGKQREVETLHQQLELVRAPTEELSDAVKTHYDAQVVQFKEMLKAKDIMIEKKGDEITSLQDRLEQRARDVGNLESQVQLLSEKLAGLQRQLDDGPELPLTDGDEALLSQLQQQSQLIDDLQSQLSQSQSNFRCRQDEFNRAIAELETQRRVPQNKSVQNGDANTEQLKLQYEAEIAHLKEEHEKEIVRIRRLHENDDGDSTLHLDRDIRPELDAHVALDGRFMEQIGRTRQSGVGGEQSPKTNDNPETSDRLRDVMSNLRRESKRVYSLSQELLLQSQQQFHPNGLLSGDEAQAAWVEERQSLLAANSSLKRLLSASQSADPSKFAEEEDWRADLLHAVTEVFNAETKNVNAQLAAYKKEAENGDGPSIERLEKLIHEQNERQRSALQSLFEADRESLMAELQELRARVNNYQHSGFEEQSRIRSELVVLEEQFSKREWHLKRQLELMEYKLQQEKVMREDLGASLEKEKSRNIELSSLLTREKTSGSDLQGDLADTQSQLMKLRDALEREQNRLISSSNALDEERQRTSLLNESLTRERLANQQIQEDLDFERVRNQRIKDRNHQLVEKLKREAEMEKERRVEAHDSVERERMTLASLRRELELERDSSRALDHKAKAKIAELKSSLDMERARTEEINSALQRERQLNAQMRETLDEERNSLHETSSREKAAITDLQAMLDRERSKLLELHTSVEREKNKVQTLNGLLGAEQSRATEELEHERATCRQLKNTLETLQAQKHELTRQAEFEADKVSALQANAERLQASLASTKDRLREMESVVENARSLERQRLKDWDQEREQERRKLYDKDTELLRLRQKMSDLELQLAEQKRSTMQSMEERDLTRLKTAMTGQRRPSRSEADSTTSISNNQPNSPVNVHRWQHRQLESFRQRLHLVVIQTQDEIVKATDRMHTDPQAIIDSIDDLNRLYTRLKDLQTELDKLQPSMVRDVEITSGSVAGLNEKILKHNSELSHLLTTLSDEKHELYRKTEYLRDEIQELRTQLNNNEIDATEERIESERVLWSQERATLALQKNNAEKEIVHLKAKIRRLEIELEREREKYSHPQSNGEVADREKMQRLYGKYLKAESFKKSLIYQKKYLLILLGGYQDTERETLSMLAKMGGFENGQFHEYKTSLSPLSRFRSAARVVVACSRMRLLVKKWRRATRVGSQPVVGNMQTTSGASATYLPTANGYSPPRTQQYNHEEVVDHRWTLYSYPLNHTPPTKESTAHNRRHLSRRNLDLTGAFDIMQDGEVFHDSGAVSPMTNPDEDQSLNAYIEGLEHIQVRLGQVSQGNFQAQR